VASALERARPLVLAVLLVLYAGGSLAWAARWRALLGFAGIDLRLSQVWRISTEAQAGGVLLPGGIGGDALRIASVLARPTRAGEARASAAIVVASVLLDRALGLSVIAGLAAVLGLAWGGVHAGPLVVLLAGIPVAFLLGLRWLRHPALRDISWSPARRLGGWLAPVLAYMGHPRAPRAIAIAAMMSLGVAGTQFTVIRGLVFALGAVPTEEKWVYVGTAMALIVAAIPALPGGWGTADAAYVFFFGLAGLRPGIALAVCLLYRLFWYISAAVGAVLQLTRPDNARIETASTPPNMT
jgi:uncharacterized membrane protein YbhN (UPF0104 family)